MSPGERELWMALRQALLIGLGAVETYLGLERSAPPRRVRRSRLARLERDASPSLTGCFGGPQHDKGIGMTEVCDD